jgi:hypothetical protein
MTYSQQTTMVPAKTNHVLHLILTLISCGMWSPIWLIVALYNVNRMVPHVGYGVSTQAYPQMPMPLARPVQQLPAMQHPTMEHPRMQQPTMQPYHPDYRR